MIRSTPSVKHSSPAPAPWASPSTATSHTVYVADSTDNDVAVFGDARPIVTVEPPTPHRNQRHPQRPHRPRRAGRHHRLPLRIRLRQNLRRHGALRPRSRLEPSRLELHRPTDVTATITGLSPGTRDHYRFVVIEFRRRHHLHPGSDLHHHTASSDRRARLGQSHCHHRGPNAQLNPNGLDTTYRFEYGPTHRLRPIGSGPGRVAQRLQRRPGDRRPPRQSHAARRLPLPLVATNADGTTTAPTTPSTSTRPAAPTKTSASRPRPTTCPTAAPTSSSRPATPAAPSCIPGGPNTGYATNPSRFSFTGLWSTIPGSGGDPINSVGDLYVATRTNTGWVTQLRRPAGERGRGQRRPAEGLPNSTHGVR